MMFTKEWLSEKLKQRAAEFILKQSLVQNNSAEMKEFISIAKQIRDNNGFGVEYPIKLKFKLNLIRSFIELMGFYVQSEDIIRNAKHEIVDRLSITFLLDIDIDTQNFEGKWIKDDESIHLYILNK